MTLRSHTGGDASRRFYYIDATVTGPESLAVSAGFCDTPDADRSVILIKSGDDWGCHSVAGDLVVSLAYCAEGHTLCGVGRNGLVRRVSSGAAPFTLGAIAGRFESLQVKAPARQGALERIRFVHGQPYACGWGGQVYRLDADGAEDIGIDGETPNLIDIDGRAVDDLFAVGLGGALWHFDGCRWRSLDSPTRSHLHAVKCLDDGRVLLAGAAGAVYVGDGAGWQPLSAPDASGNIWSVAEWHGDVYAVHGERGVLRHDGQAFQAVQAPSGGSRPHRLVTGFGSLWAIGATDLFRFDGERWHRVVCPENE